MKLDKPRWVSVFESAFFFFKVSKSGQRLIAGIALAAIPMILSGCGGASGTTPPPAQPSINASAQPATINAGQSTMLTWNAANANTVSIDQGIGNVATSGSMSVSPSATTTYHFTASGSGGTATMALTINVATPAPPNPSPTPTPTPPPPTPTPAPGTANVPTWHMDNARTGLNADEGELTPANVNAGSFGKLFSYMVDGYMYAQPLYVSGLTIQGAKHNVVFAATENQTIYAFDADNFGNGSPLWKVSLLQAGEVPQPGGNPLPNQGLTSTPVIDLNAKIMYVFTAQKSPSGPFFRLHALDIITGVERPGSPVAVTATVPGTNKESVNGMVSLTSACLQRAALLLSQGTVYIGFSACFNGWLLSYDATSLSQVGALDMSPNADGYGQFGGAGGVWMGGGGPASDAQGNVYLTTGNGAYDGGPEWGDSVLRVNAQLHVLDHFTSAEFAFLQCADQDLSAGGVMLVPGQSDLIAGGKIGELYVLNSLNLGGEQTNDTGALQDFFMASTFSSTCVDNNGVTLTGLKGTESIYATASWFNGNVYIGADPAPLSQFSYSNGQLAAVATSPESIATLSYGTTAFVSANGTSNGIVWMIDHGLPIQAPGGGPTSAILRAFDAANIGTELYNSSQNAADVPGFGIKFTSPIVANGKVFIGTAHDPLTTTNPQGELDVYGLK